MITEKIIFDIHRLMDNGYSHRKVAEILNIDRGTVAKYHSKPDMIPPKPKKQVSKLDGYYDAIHEMLEEYPTVSAILVLEKLKANGFAGKITIVRDYLRKIRKNSRQKPVFTRFESSPGQQMQIDWGHFDSIDYDGDKRKLYCLAVIESYSRKLYVEFTHSQNQETLHFTFSSDQCTTR